MLSVFLGGTCGDSTWREELISMLNDKIKVFNPKVKHWTEECQIIEGEHKEKDDILLFVITPETDNAYSISEVTASSIAKPESTIVCVMDNINGESFKKHELNAWKKILADLKKLHRAYICKNLKEVAKELNRRALKKAEIEEALC